MEKFKINNLNIFFPKNYIIGRINVSITMLGNKQAEKSLYLRSLHGFDPVGTGMLVSLLVGLTSVQVQKSLITG